MNDREVSRVQMWDSRRRRRGRGPHCAKRWWWRRCEKTREKDSHSLVTLQSNCKILFIFISSSTIPDTIFSPQHYNRENREAAALYIHAEKRCGKKKIHTRANYARWASRVLLWRSTAFHKLKSSADNFIIRESVAWRRCNTFHIFLFISHLVGVCHSREPFSWGVRASSTFVAFYNTANKIVYRLLLLPRRGKAT